MDFENNSILSVNNHFYKVYRRFVEKKKNNEAGSDDIEWINNQLLHENRKISENAVNVLSFIGSSDFGVSLNALISALSRSTSNNYDLICDGIFKLLQNVKSSFGIIDKPHPGILMISESSEKMLYLSRKIEETFENKYIEDPVGFLRPVLIATLCSDSIYAESSEIWRQVLKCGDEKIINDILSLRRTTSASSCMLFNSMAVLKFKEIKNIENLLLLIASTKLLVEHSLDPSKNIELITKNIEIFEANKDLLNVGIYMLAEILQRTSITFIPKLVALLQILIEDKKYYHPIILPMILDGLIQVIACPSFIGKKIKNVERLLNFIKTADNQEALDTRPKFSHFNEDITSAYHICLFLEMKNLNFQKLSTDHERFLWRRHQLVLRGFLQSNILPINQWLIVLDNLIEISRVDNELKSSLVMPLLFKLSESNDPKTKVSILQNLPHLGASTEVFGTIKALSNGIVRSMVIDLHLRLWKIEPRIYPFLFKVLVEKSPKDDEDFYLDIVRASAIKEICDLKPYHGKDLLSIISDILNQSLESKDKDIPAALAIDAIVILCQNHIINVTSTWKAISLTTRYEKRPRVIKSLCKFFALIPQFKRNNSEYELLMKDIVARVFHMIQTSDTHGIKCALEALKSWNYDQLTLDMIPINYREGIALPEAPVGMEVSILDLEVPGECYVQLMTKVDPSALKSAGDLISHFIAQEISEYRSGHYIVKNDIEPINYKTLPKQSIVKALTQFVIQQATTKKEDKIVGEEILIEALRVLSQKYSRPLPPLNWTFLHELVHKGEEVKAQCIALAAKQSVISGTAKRLAENILVNVDFNSHEDIEACLNILADLCNGISTEVLKAFFEKGVKHEDINNYMQKCLKDEKSIKNRENLAMVITTYVKNCAILKDTIKLIPSNVMAMLNLDSSQKIKFRCEILKESSNVENPAAWINELIAEEFYKNENRQFLIENFVDLIMDSKQIFPKKKWLSEFMTMTENKIIEKVEVNFLLDIFSTALICFSGYLEIFEKNKDNLIDFLPLAVELLSTQESFNEIIGSVFDFIYYVIEDNSSHYKEPFKLSIITAKNHPHFQKSKKWLKILQALVISK